jgi:starch phosphorylase
MKFALNGALTLGTLDGANLEIREAVGESNFFAFGLSAPEANARRRAPCRSREVLDADDELARALELVANGTFSRGDRALFAPLVQSLVESDPFLVLPDFRSYAAARERAEAAFLDQAAWTYSSIVNVSRSGRFSSDRAVEEYRTRVWNVEAAKVPPVGHPEQ